jgi:P4 family phage/plasmid primase-like protien
MNHYLSTHKAVDKAEYTHTRIGSAEHSVYGGSYKIDDIEEFFRHYYHHVFEKGEYEYLTERQHDVGPLVIDIDFRYFKNTRAYTLDHIVDFIEITLDELNTLFTIQHHFPIYVFEKPSVQVTTACIKDGIHIMIGLNLDRTSKELLRKRLLQKMDIWENLKEHISNTWESVLDDGIFKATTNWQVYGSRKPGYSAYQLTHIYQCQKTNQEYELNHKDGTTFDLISDLHKLSVRYLDYETIVLKEAFRSEYDQLKGIQRKKLKVISSESKTDSYMDIKNSVMLNRAIDTFLAGLDVKDHKLQEVHQYTMCLTESYYNNFDKWIRVGWALKNTDHRLFITWIKFSSQSPKFSYADISNFYGQWCSWNKPTCEKTGEKLTERSIMYWARNDNLPEYEKAKQKSIDYICDIAIKDGCTETDIATILYYWYKDTFVCASIKHRVWFQYHDQRWVESDSGTTLRGFISDMKGIYGLFTKKLFAITQDLNQLEENDERKPLIEAKLKKICGIMIELKKTSNKENIMKEASHLFYVKNFMNLLDNYDHILCFTNCIVDFNQNIHRPGLPEDFTSKCTNIPYIPLTPEHDTTVEEITTFMHQLFPDDELYEYMWDHAASALIGRNTNQTFNIYIGNGRNGKSKFVELMSAVLGEYKATIPVSFITQKRTSIGGTSSEIAQLVGVRYAVMQEPSIGDVINEGIMKELTGGDPIQCRALYKESFTFYPRCKVVMQSNIEPEFRSNDDGTWRRVRGIHFKSVFNENPVKGDPFKPYQFPVDKNIDAKFEGWKPIFMSMLVNRAFKTHGNVVDCKMVLARSESYRMNQDHYGEFINECIQKDPHGCIKESELYDTFKDWWTLLYGRNVPKGKELFNYMTNKFGPKTRVGREAAAWRGLSIVRDDETTDDI